MFCYKLGKIRVFWRGRVKGFLPPLAPPTIAERVARMEEWQLLGDPKSQIHQKYLHLHYKLDRKNKQTYIQASKQTNKQTKAKYIKLNCNFQMVISWSPVMPIMDQNCTHFTNSTLLNTSLYPSSWPTRVDLRDLYRLSLKMGRREMNKNLSCTASGIIQYWFQIFRNATSPKQWYLQIDRFGRLQIHGIDSNKVLTWKSFWTRSHSSTQFLWDIESCSKIKAYNDDGQIRTQHM